MINILKNKKITLCVCGSISAYKSVSLASEWVQSGADVKVLMTALKWGRLDVQSPNIIILLGINNNKATTIGTIIETEIIKFL